MNLLSLIILIAAIVTIIGTVSIVDLFIDTWERELEKIGSFIKAIISMNYDIKGAYLYVYNYPAYLAMIEDFDTDEFYCEELELHDFIILDEDDFEDTPTGVKSYIGGEK